MAATPLIVSLWRDRDKQGFLCSGLLLGPRHILTVRHAFQQFRNDQPVFVRLIDGVEGDVEARVLQCHRERDAAIVELVTAVEVAARPRLQRTSNRSFNGRDATLRVIDPDTHNRATASNYAVADFDHHTGEYVLSPENARGHSGGIVEVDGQVIGLLSRRKNDDPLCRAVAMDLLWSWIRDTPGNAAPDPAALPSAPVGIRVSPAYRVLVQRVRERVRECLLRPGTDLLVRHWREDPLASFHDRDPSGQLKSLLYDLHKATRSSIPEWRRLSVPDPDEIKSDCRRLVSELVKLAVDPAGDGSERDLGGVAASAPERLHLACQFAGTADVVYFALGDLETLLERRSKEADIASAQAVHQHDLLPTGTGEDQRQALLRKLWVRVMGKELPARIEPKQEALLVARIHDHLERDGKRYLLTAPGPREWLTDSDYSQWADELKLGLVLYEEGECPFLLMAEPELISILLEYLELLETL